MRATFDTAEQEARKVKGTDAYAVLAIAFAQLGQGQRAAAWGQTTRRLAGTAGAASRSQRRGRGDLAVVRGPLW